MFKNLKMAVKLALGFGIMSLLIMLVGGMSWNSMRNIESSTEKVAKYQEINDAMFLVRQTGKDFLMLENMELVKKMEAPLHQAKTVIEEIRPLFKQAEDLKRLDDIKAGVETYGKDVDRLAGAVAAGQEAFATWGKLGNRFSQLFQEAQTGIRDQTSGRGADNTLLNSFNVGIMQNFQIGRAHV